MMDRAEREITSSRKRSLRWQLQNNKVHHHTLLLLIWIIIACTSPSPSHAFQISNTRTHTRARSQVGSGNSHRNENGDGLKRISSLPLSALSTSTSSTSSTTTKSRKNNKPSPPQVVEFIEPKTNVKVVLIGTMHYNPTSIAMVERTIDEYGSRNQLGSVLVESCDVRWNTTSEILQTTRGKLLQPVLTSEMKVASDVAMNKYNRPVVLGDQRIDATGESLKLVLKETLVDLANPLFGGWKRFYGEFQKAADVALPSSSSSSHTSTSTNGTAYEYLDARSILDPRLLIAAPVSFAKYPLSFLARNPLSTMVVFAILGGLGFVDDATSSGISSFADASFEEQIGSIVSSLLFAGLEFAVFGRILVQVLLAERNEIIARNIIDQCQIYARKSGVGDAGSGGDGGSRPNLDFAWFSSIIGGGGGSNGANGAIGAIGANDNDSGASTSTSTTTRETIYVPGSIRVDSDTKKPQTNYLNDGKEEKVVLCVLGMAHCNGIVNLLKNELIKDEY